MKLGNSTYCCCHMEENKMSSKSIWSFESIADFLHYYVKICGIPGVSKGQELPAACGQEGLICIFALQSWKEL